MNNDIALWAMTMDNKFTRILIISLVILAMLKITDFLFSKIMNIRKEMSIVFLRTSVKAIVVFIGLFRIGLEFQLFRDLSKSILLSSSLLIAVAGFASQRSLEDLVAGIMITIFKPYELEDRITISEKNISGYIESITLRHTIVRSFTNSRMIIPNSEMNKYTIENAHMIDQRSAGYLDFQMALGENENKLTNIIQEEVKNHPMTIDSRTKEDIENKVPYCEVYLNQINNDCVNLRAVVWTKSIDDNFKACSDLRKSVYDRMVKEEIRFPTRNVRIEK